MAEIQPLIERQVREQIAADIEAESDRAEADPSTLGWHMGMDTAWRIARGVQ
jgi:hypothetical protein